MTREQQAISANFDLILNAIRGAEPRRAGEYARLGSNQSAEHAQEPGHASPAPASAEMPTAPIPSDGLCEECEHPIRLHGKVVVSQQARSNAGAHIQVEAALKASLEARDNYLDHISGCDD